MPLSPGTRFGPYEIADEIGAGGMGVVYGGRTRISNATSPSKSCRSRLRSTQKVSPAFNGRPGC